MFTSAGGGGFPKTSGTFNPGQTRTFAGGPHVFAVSTSNRQHRRARARGGSPPRVRANGRSVNLTFNVPGFALGGVAVDPFPAGAPSIGIPLSVQDSAGRYRTPSGTMKFPHGSVIAATGTRRNGWTASDARSGSSGCP